MRSHSQRDEKSISGHRSTREQQSTHVNQRVNISAGCFKDARDLCAAAVIRTTSNYSPACTTLLESARIFPTLNCIKHSARRSADDLSLIVASPSVRRRELGWRDGFVDAVYHDIPACLAALTRVHTTATWPNWCSSVQFSSVVFTLWFYILMIRSRHTNWTEVQFANWSLPPSL